MGRNATTTPQIEFGHARGYHISILLTVFSVYIGHSVLVAITRDPGNNNIPPAYHVRANERDCLVGPQQHG